MCSFFQSNFGKLWHCNMAQNERKIRSIVVLLLFFHQTLANFGIEKCVVSFQSNFGKLWHCNMAQNERKIRILLSRCLFQTLANCGIEKCGGFSSQTLANFGNVIWLKMSEKSDQ